MTDPAQNLIGGRYEIIASLGKGGMGVVYKAYDPVLDRSVAIKKMAASIVDHDEFRQRFFVEARAVARLNHPNIVTIHELEEDEGGIYIVMEMLDGVSLLQVMKQQVPLSRDTQVTLLSKICSGLDYAHVRGIVHRDIKPANLVLTTTGSVKILDFGIARFASSELTSLGGPLLGTPHYMSPEQIEGRTVDARADWFSFGAVAYELVAGAKPFDAPSMPALLMKITSSPHVPLVDVLPDTVAPLSAIVDRLLAKDREQRPANGADVQCALNASGDTNREDLIADVVRRVMGAAAEPTIIQPISSRLTAPLVAARPTTPIALPGITSSTTPVSITPASASIRPPAAPAVPGSPGAQEATLAITPPPQTPTSTATASITTATTPTAPPLTGASAGTAAGAGQLLPPDSGPPASGPATGPMSPPPSAPRSQTAAMAPPPPSMTAAAGGAAATPASTVGVVGAPSPVAARPMGSDIPAAKKSLRGALVVVMLLLLLIGVTGTGAIWWWLSSGGAIGGDRFASLSSNLSALLGRTPAPAPTSTTSSTTTPSASTPAPAVTPGTQAPSEPSASTQPVNPNPSDPGATQPTQPVQPGTQPPTGVSTQPAVTPSPTDPSPTAPNAPVATNPPTDARPPSSQPGAPSSQTPTNSATPTSPRETPAPRTDVTTRSATEPVSPPSRPESPRRTAPAKPPADPVSNVRPEPPPNTPADHGADAPRVTGRDTRAPLDQATVNAFKSTSGTSSNSTAGYAGADSPMLAASVARIKDTLESYSQAIEHQDLETLHSIRDPLPAAESAQAQSASPTVVRFSDVDVRTDGKQATARARRAVSVGGSVKSNAYVEIHLTRRPAGWVITEIR